MCSVPDILLAYILIDGGKIMLTYTYVSKGKLELMEKPKPVLMHERDAIVKVTLASICSSDLQLNTEVFRVQSRELQLAMRW